MTKIGNNTPKDYSFGYEEGMLDYQSYRAVKSLDFVLPHIKPDMKVLECGSGPGTTTFEIAKRLPEGSVTGIDINKQLVDSNNEKASCLELGNINFEHANLLSLPYSDSAFDVVYMQAVLVHILTPVDAVREAKRVLKPGGKILIKEPVMDRAVVSPETPLMLESFELIQKTISSYGGDASIGRKLWPILNRLGFNDIFISSTWEQPGSLSEWSSFYGNWVRAMEGDVWNIIIKNGWADENRLLKINEAWLEFANAKAGYAGSPWGEAVAVK